MGRLRWLRETFLSPVACAYASAGMSGYCLFTRRPLQDAAIWLAGAALWYIGALIRQPPKPRAP